MFPLKEEKAPPTKILPSDWTLALYTVPLNPVPKLELNDETKEPEDVILIKFGAIELPLKEVSPSQHINMFNDSTSFISKTFAPAVKPEPVKEKEKSLEPLVFSLYIP